MQDAETGKGRCMSMQAMQTLYELRENNQLCDAIIVLDDGTEIPIHRALLCACSSYFKAAFTTLLHNKTETKVQIPGVSSDMMHILLKYAYLRNLDLDKNNVYDVLITADYLSMLGALEMCCTFLEGMIDPKNCIGILLFARNHFCNELSQIAWRFIMKNFIQVAQQSEELLLLSLKEFQEIINSDNLNVKSEEIVWETILKWINHEPEQRKGFIVSLMKCIRLGLLETQFFMERVKDHPYVAACEESRPMVIETLKFLYDLERIMHKPYMARKHGLPLLKCDFSLMAENDPSPDVLIMNSLKELCALEPDSQPLREKWRNARGIKDCSKNLISPFDNDLRWERNSERLFPAFKLFNYRRRNGEVVTPEIARPRLPHEVLFAIGGWSGGSPTNYIETYDTRADRWVKIDEVDPSGPRAYHGTAVVGYSIYVIGGFDGMDYFNSCRCFDPVRKSWKEIAPMHARRCYVSTAVLNDIIYAMGGYDGHHRQNTAEKYDFTTNQWSLIASMNMQRSDASACSLNNKIYITGGFNGQECMHSAEVYDPDVNQWTLIAAMRSRRSGVSCISYHDYVYVIGGFNGISRMCSGEKYNPHTNTWTPVPDMYNPRSNFAIEVIDDMIFAIGGFNGVTTIYHVECYDEKTNEWYEATDMNIYRSALSACVVDGLPNIGDYIHKHRDKLMEEKRQKMIALENQRQGAGNVPNPPNPPENVITAAHGNLQQLNILQQLNNNNDVNNNQNQVVPVAQDQAILMELDDADNDA